MPSTVTTLVWKLMTMYAIEVPELVRRVRDRQSFDSGRFR
jgi:hypothetical protein